ncbi:MAG: 30S ribosomal protein S18 [Clostridia bacterium]|nr:30S ribosomal protein S18 [Clostridia bacterium]
MEENNNAETSEVAAAPAAEETSAANTEANANTNNNDRGNGERRYNNRNNDRGNGDRPYNRGKKGGNRRAPRKKVCVFCQEKVAYIDYKDVARLRKFITEGAKMIPRRMTGTCAKHQRELARAIKNARQAALLPFVGE